MLIKVNCSGCDKEIYKYPKQLKQKRYFCTHSCYTKSKRKILSDIITDLYVRGTPIYTLAKDFNYSCGSIRKHLISKSITLRTQKEANALWQKSKYEALPWQQIASDYVNRKMQVKQLATKHGCSRGVIAHKLNRMGVRRHGSVGENNGSWKGGIRITSGGYVRILKSSHPFADRRGYITRSRFIWEEVHEKYLPREWVVHHLDGVKDNDTSENLVAYPKLKHNRLIPYLIKRIKSLEIELKALKTGQNILPLQFSVGEEVM